MLAAIGEDAFEVAASFLIWVGSAGIFFLGTVGAALCLLAALITLLFCAGAVWGVSLGVDAGAF